ncbi:MAG: Lrp/AsnC family transcriptional regulator [Candidatus Omnitrophica bacterium]|nr:Lrp/AsnC family transcriptional regulator [Candidatus Omnitrophota bacterium]
MSKKYYLDDLMKSILSKTQQGLEISAEPYKSLAKSCGIEERELISRLKWLKKEKLLKRINFSFNTKKLGLVSTLIGCQIPEEKIKTTREIINNRQNISHNYLREHRLNMWFTLSARSKQELKFNLDELKKKLKPKEIVSLPTEKLYKLRLNLNVN